MSEAFNSIRVEAETGPGGSLESGDALLKIRRKNAPSINVTSVFLPTLGEAVNDDNPVCGPPMSPPLPENPIYQTAATGAAAKRAWSFLLWGDNNEPLDNVRLQRTGKNRYAQIRDDGDRTSTAPWHHWKRVVGFVHIDAPPGARGQRIRQIDCPSSMPAAPVIGFTTGIGPQPVGRLDLRFVAGDVPGVYTTIFSLIRGNDVDMVVTVD